MLDSKNLSESFQQLYGQKPRLFRAPGRVNLIGEHTDYNDGFVMPVALDFATLVAAAPRADGRLVIRSADFEEEVSYPLDDRGAVRAGHWSDYVRGVAVVALRQGLDIQGATLLLQGDVPMGAGLSSSASVEVATALALLSLSDITLSKPDLALLCQRAENEFVGMRCGIMDQFISACGQQGHALLVDCRSLETRLLPLSSNAQVVICNSMVRHELTGGEYNERRQACEEGARLLGVKALRDATPEAVDGLDDEILRRRCRHVVAENLRVQSAAEALVRGDFAEFGRLMLESHQSLRDDYQVSCPELDQLVEIARSLPGVYGSRMTGGGFGGCTVSLVRRQDVPDFVQAIADSYPTEQIFVCDASAGATEI
jgi:galactokinase